MSFAWPKVGHVRPFSLNCLRYARPAEAVPEARGLFAFLFVIVCSFVFHLFFFDKVNCLQQYARSGPGDVGCMGRRGSFVGKHVEVFCKFRVSRRVIFPMLSASSRVSLSSVRVSLRLSASLCGFSRLCMTFPFSLYF